MKLKYYLRGLGTGILFATIILFISYSYKMSDNQIKKRASELGMVYPDKETSSEQNTTSNNEEDKTSSKEETTDATSDTKEPVSEQGTTKEPVKEETSTEEKPTEENTTKQEETIDENTTKDNQPEKSYVLTVTSKTNSWDVAKKLRNAGIIDDAEEFNDYLCDNGYASNIQNGKFTITSNMSYKEIAETITSKPKKD